MWVNTRKALDKLEHLLLCKICHKIVEDPFTLGNCDHFFCRKCIKDHIGKCCPVCNLYAYAANVQTCHRIAEILKQCKELNSIIDDCNQSKNIEENVAHSGRRSPENLNDNKHEVIIEPSIESMPNLSVVLASPKERTQNSFLEIATSPVPNSRISLGSTPTSTINSVVPSPGNGIIKRRNAKGETVLHLAAIKGRVEEVARLLKLGINPDMKDNAGWTALHEACNHGYSEIVELLLDYNANINMPGLDGITPLHDAVCNKRNEVVKLLMARGANPYLRNAHGCTPIDNADDDLKAVILSFEFKENGVPEVPTAFQPTELVLLGTGLTEEQKMGLKNYGKIFNVNIVEEYSPKVTHLISSCGDHRTCPRTMKYLLAVITGKWIVSFQWIEECIQKNQLISESDFEVKGTQAYPSCNGPKRGRLNAEAQKPGLFSGCHFYLYGTFEHPSAPSKTDLIKLIHLGGGKILQKAPTLDVINAATPTVPFHATGTLASFSYYIIHGDEKRCVIKYDSKYVKSLPVSWLLECISKFRLVHS